MPIRAPFGRHRSTTPTSGCSIRTRGCLERSSALARSCASASAGSRPSPPEENDRMSTHNRPVFDLVDIVTKDFEATIAFYQALGLEVDAGGGGDDEIWHADVHFPNGASLHVDNVALAQIYNAGWRRPEESSSVIVGFSVESREAVDHLYDKLTDAGYEGRQVPYDAFWGARYAIVADPNGIDVGIMSPMDDAKRSRPSRSPDT